MRTEFSKYGEMIGEYLTNTYSNLVGEFDDVWFMHIIHGHYLKLTYGFESAAHIHRNRVVTTQFDLRDPNMFKLIEYTINSAITDLLNNDRITNV